MGEVIGFRASGKSGKVKFFLTIGQEKLEFFLGGDHFSFLHKLTFFLVNGVCKLLII